MKLHPDIKIVEDNNANEQNYWNATQTHLAAGSGADDIQAFDVSRMGQVTTVLAGRFTDLGTVPESAPVVPLAADLARQQRSLRLRPTASVQEVDLDLRRDSQLARSVLLHRLRILGVGWGELADTGRTTGTFKESWTLEWRPELAVDLVEAGPQGQRHVVARIAVGDGEDVQVVDLRAAGLEVREGALHGGAEADEARLGARRRHDDGGRGTTAPG